MAKPTAKPRVEIYQGRMLKFANSHLKSAADSALLSLGTKALLGYGIESFTTLNTEWSWKLHLTGFRSEEQAKTALRLLKKFRF